MSVNYAVKNFMRLFGSVVIYGCGASFLDRALMD